MDLCFYNAVSTGMSVNGKRFTYVNQLASTETDLSKREEWFTCACCPPNVARLLGYIGGYLWSHTADEKNGSAEVNVHSYSSATLTVPMGSTSIELEQKSNWPWDGRIDFSLRNSSNVATTIKLRIPGWSADWQVRSSNPISLESSDKSQISPSPRNVALEKGYITLSPDWLQSNPTFQLNIPLKPRFVAPHPYANQDVVALARGPLIYCVEDFDNAWVDDHFKNVVLDPTGRITEAVMSDPKLGESCIALTAHDATSFLQVENYRAPHISLEGAQKTLKKHPDVGKLHFIPYCLRDNRGGKGHMRVGIRRKH